MRHVGLTIVGAALALGQPAATAGGAAWPGFHGGGALDGRVPGALPDAPRLLWSVPAGSGVRSSAAIADGVAFLGSDDGALYAFDLASGATRWRFATGGPIEATPLLV